MKTKHQGIVLAVLCQLIATSFARADETQKTAEPVAAPEIPHFVRVTPSSLLAHDLERVIAFQVQQGSPRHRVQIPHRPAADATKPSREFWLVICKAPLAEKDQDLRGVVLGSWTPNILSVTKLAPQENVARVDPESPEQIIAIELSDDIIKRAYVVHDYEGIVLDGGNHYTFDLATFIEKKAGSASVSKEKKNKP